MADLDELVGGVGVGVSSYEGGGEVGPSSVVSAAVGVEALEGQVLLHPWRVFECVGLEERDDVVLNRHVLAAPYRQMLQRVDARAKHAAHERDARHGGVAEVEAGQAAAVGRYNLLQEGVEGVGLGLALAVVGRLVARRAERDCGLGQPEGQRLPCQRVSPEEAAQMGRAVVELEDGEGGELREERFQDGGVGRHDRLEEAEGGFLAARIRVLLGRGGDAGDGGRGRGRGCCRGAGGIAAMAGIAVPEEIRLALLLRAHACRRRSARRACAISLQPGQP